MSPLLSPWLVRWNLLADGEPILTPRAQLLPVRHDGAAAMLKVSTEPEERLGGRVLAWWGGRGAARVLEAEGDALLMERAEGARSLRDYARNGRDDEATEILCDALATLHAPRGAPPADLIPLPVWFRDLALAARTHGGILVRSLETAGRLLAAPCEEVVLHGDIHHDNVLDFGTRGWLAIDPKRLFGERGFDYANIFTNPDIDDPSIRVAVRPERFRRRLDIVTGRSEIDRRRLLEWILAWSGLSAAWIMGGGDHPEVDLAIAQLAAAELER